MEVMASICSQPLRPFPLVPEHSPAWCCPHHVALCLACPMSPTSIYSGVQVATEGLLVGTWQRVAWVWVLFWAVWEVCGSGSQHWLSTSRVSREPSSDLCSLPGAAPGSRAFWAAELTLLCPPQASSLGRQSPRVASCLAHNLCPREPGLQTTAGTSLAPSSEWPGCSLLLLLVWHLVWRQLWIPSLCWLWDTLPSCGLCLSQAVSPHGSVASQTCPSLACSELWARPDLVSRAAAAPA